MFSLKFSSVYFVAVMRKNKPSAYSKTLPSPNFLVLPHLPTTSGLVGFEVVHVGLCIASLLLLLPGLRADPGVVQGLLGRHSLSKGGMKEVVIRLRSPV